MTTTDSLASCLPRAGVTPFRIDGPLTGSTVASWRTRLLACAERENGVTIDLSGVSEIDTLGLQLILAARRTAELARIPFVVTASSAAVDAHCFELSLNPSVIPFSP